MVGGKEGERVKLRWIRDKCALVSDPGAGAFIDYALRVRSLQLDVKATSHFY